MTIPSLVSRVSILGVGVNPLTMPQVLAVMQCWVAAREPHYICCVPIHSIVNCLDDPTLLPVFNSADLVTPDGMGVVHLLRRAGHPTERVYGPDLLLAACAHGLSLGWRHYFYGGQPDVLAALTDRLTARYPDLIIVGVSSPPFRSLSPTEEAEDSARIRAAAPDLVWVGIGSPRQEAWMFTHVQGLGVPVLVGVGAAFDYLSGFKPEAPRWVQRAGLQWLHRLLTEPRRLFRRYLVGYPRFLWAICKAQLAKRRV